MSGHDLIAGGDHHQAVELVGLGHDLNGVLDQLATGQRISHSFVAHGYAIADPYGLELKWNSTGREDACLNRFPQSIEMNVAGYEIVTRVYNADEGTTNLLIAQAGSFEKSPMRRSLSAYLGDIASHIQNLLRLCHFCA